MDVTGAITSVSTPPSEFAAVRPTALVISNDAMDKGSNTFFATTPALLGSNATFTGAARDCGVDGGVREIYSFFNGYFFSDKAGAARLEGSNDSVNWFVTAQAPLVANTPLPLFTALMFRYNRLVLVNGAVAQTVFQVASSFTES